MAVFICTKKVYCHYIVNKTKRCGNCWLMGLCKSVGLVKKFLQCGGDFWDEAKAQQTEAVHAVTSMACMSMDGLSNF